MEKRRRKAQKSEILNLQSVIPYLAGKKASTITVIRKAKEYIENLERKVQSNILQPLTPVSPMQPRSFGSLPRVGYPSSLSLPPLREYLE